MVYRSTPPLSVPECDDWFNSTFRLRKSCRRSRRRMFTLAMECCGGHREAYMLDRNQIKAAYGVLLEFHQNHSIVCELRGTIKRKWTSSNHSSRQNRIIISTPLNIRSDSGVPFASRNWLVQPVESIRVLVTAGHPALSDSATTSKYYPMMGFEPATYGLRKSSQSILLRFRETLICLRTSLQEWLLMPVSKHYLCYLQFLKISSQRGPNGVRCRPTVL